MVVDVGGRDQSLVYCPCRQGNEQHILNGNLLPGMLTAAKEIDRQPRYHVDRNPKHVREMLIQRNSSLGGVGASKRH